MGSDARAVLLTSARISCRHLFMKSFCLSLCDRMPVIMSRRFFWNRRMEVDPLRSLGGAPMDDDLMVPTECQGEPPRMHAAALSRDRPPRLSRLSANTTGPARTSASQLSEVTQSAALFGLSTRGAIQFDALRASTRGRPLRAVAPMGLTCRRGVGRLRVHGRARRLRLTLSASVDNSAATLPGDALRYFQDGTTRPLTARHTNVTPPPIHCSFRRVSAAP